VASGTVRVKGLNETVRAFNKLERSVAREIQKELKHAAEPVATEAKSRISKYRGASLNTIRPRARGASVFVTQNARKVTGLRGDYGVKQQRLFEQALEDKQPLVVRGIEETLDRITQAEGF
jgi:hypothetical protein